MSSNTKLLQWEYLCLNVLLKELETIDRRTQFNFIGIDRIVEKQMDKQDFLQNFQSKYLYFQSTILEILNQNQYSFEEIYQALIDEDTGLFIKEAYEFTVAKQIAELLGNLIDPITNKTLRYRLKSLLSYQRTQLSNPEKNDSSKQPSLFSKNTTELDKFTIKRAIEVLSELPATKTIKTRTELISLFNRHPEEIEKEIVLKQFAEHTSKIIKQAYPLDWSLVYDWDLRATLDDPESNYSETESIFKFYIAMRVADLFEKQLSKPNANCTVEFMKNEIEQLSHLSYLPRNLVI